MSLSAPVIAFAIVGGFLGKVMAGQDSPYQHLKIFDDVVSMISSQYVEEVNIDKVMHGAMHGLADGLDPDSAYLTPDEVKQVETGAPLPIGDVGIDLTRQYYLRVIAARDSFYMATVSETGWPYVQHRGGPLGFAKVLGPNLIGFADFKGNRQLVSTGNLDVTDRVSLFMMDYPRRTRLKLLGHARVLDAREHPELVDQLAPESISRKLFPERALRGDFFRVVHEGVQGVTKTLGEFIGALSDEVAKEVGFEA
jgi:hypothetical protein